MENKSKIAIIIGAGPAGLACAYELIKLKANIKPIIIEKADCVGGISRTVYDGKSGVDIGGHRLFTNDDYIKSIWQEFLPLQNAPSIDDILCGRFIEYPKIGKDPNKEDDVMLVRKRFSSIMYNSKIFDYPIKLKFDLIRKLGIITTIRAGLSYLKSVFFKRKEENLQDFMINRFGAVLYEIFFKDYTKKVWGVDASRLSSEWGEQRIRKLSLYRTFLNAFLSLVKLDKFSKDTSLIDEFYYPKYGCSQLWNLMAKYILANGGKILFNAEVFDFDLSENSIKAVKYKTSNGKINVLTADYVISSMPLKDLFANIEAPYDIKKNALSLPYRDYILVSFYTSDFNLKNNTKFKTVNNITSECWIYIQEKDSIASRIQIMNNWSPYLVENFKKNYLISLEYYVNEGEYIWNLDDNKLIELALSECKKYNLFLNKDVIKSKIIREKKAYPAYWGSYEYIDNIKKYLSKFENLYLIGRNGQHKYNNMDEAMLDGINVARKMNEIEDYE